MNIEEIYDFCQKLPNVTEEFPFGEEILVFKTHQKIFFLCFLDRNPLQINLKCEPETAILLREAYPTAVFSGYHMSKRHWNTIFPEKLPSNLVKKMLIHSYEEVLKKLPLKIRKTLSYEFQNIEFF